MSATQSIALRKPAPRLFGTAALALSIVLAGCNTLAPQQSLFERMGGMPAVTAVADETISRAAADPRTTRSFEGIKLAALKESLATQICRLAGGPCTYEGASMRKAHSGLGITDAEFDLMVAMLRDAVDHNGIGTAEKNQLLKLLAPMKRDVVGG